MLLPFSVYLGWVSIAVIANATAALVALGWRGEPLPEAFWAVLMVAVGAALALLQPGAAAGTCSSPWRWSGPSWGSRRRAPRPGTRRR